MRFEDFLCENGCRFEVRFDHSSHFHADMKVVCPQCGDVYAEWAPSIQIGAFSAGLWTGERVQGIHTASSLREWEREHVIIEPGIDEAATANLHARIRRETDAIRQKTAHHIRNLRQIPTTEGREAYVRDHKPAATPDVSTTD